MLHVLAEVVRLTWWMRMAGTLVLSLPGLDAELYVAGYLGGARTHRADVRTEQNAGRDQLLFRQVPFRGRSLESPIYYGYRAGYFFTRHFGVEAELVHLKVYADLDAPVEVSGTVGGMTAGGRVPMRQYATQFEVSHGLNLVIVNAVFRRALAGGDDPRAARLVFAARGGAGPTVPRPEVIFLGRAAGRYQAGPFATQAAAGVQLRLWRGLYAFTEYKYTFTPTSFEIPDGRARFRVHSHHSATGIAIHFR